MRSYRTIQKQGFFASLILHATVFLIFGLGVDFSAPSPREGDKGISYISSYLYQSNQVQRMREVKKRAVTTEKMAQDVLPTKLPIATNDQSISSVPQSQQSSSQGEPAEQLLALLHKAIQNKQQYPAAALQMGRQGRVRVAFRLYPNGTISNEQLIKSCGTESLDLAALAAVRLAAPFKGVDLYVKTPEDFSIDVVFALADENE